MSESGGPLRVLFVCTGNSARSQMAEALLNRKGAGRFAAASAGSHPASRVNPLAVRVLAEHGIEWSGHRPRAMDGLEREPWDLVITVCDRAKESCRRLDLLLALSAERLGRRALAERVQAIGGER